MASITLRLDSRTTRDGMQQIRLRISHKCTNAFINTGVWVEPNMFSPDSVYAPIKPKAYMAREKNTQLANLVTKYNKTILDLTYENKDALACMSANDIRDCVCGVRVREAKAAKITEKKVQTADGDFMELLNQYGLSRTNANTQRHYAYVWRLLYEYMQARGLKGIAVTDVDYKMLSDVKRWLRSSGRGECTRFKVESYMRAAYKEGERLGMVSRDRSPYYDYKIERVPESDIEVLDVEDIRRLLSLDLRGVYGVDRARDVLMTSFYLCGANLIDIFNMPKCENECVFVRHKVVGKTKRALHIKIEKELKDIIVKWSGEDRMLDIYDRSHNYYSAQRRLNRQMDALSTRLGTNINMELIRRTWATIASRLEVPDRVIDKSMGHVDSSVKDRFYEQYDWSRTAMYNRKIIDYVWEGVVPNSICC